MIISIIISIIPSHLLFIPNFYTIIILGIFVIHIPKIILFINQLEFFQI